MTYSNNNTTTADDDFFALMERITQDYNQAKQPFDLLPPRYLGSRSVNEHTVFLEATHKNSLLIDCSSQVNKRFIFLPPKPIETYLHEQFPSAVGIRFRTVGLPPPQQKQYLEIIFDTPEDCDKAIIQQNANRDQQKIHVSKALSEHAQVIHIDIRRIPFKRAQEIFLNLLEIFVDYGDILVMGLYMSKNGSCLLDVAMSLSILINQKFTKRN